MSDDVGQRVSSEAGGQEREALERLRSYLAVAPIGSLFDRSTQMLLRDVLAALDAERSRAEQWERDAKTNGEMYQGEYERHQQTKACIRELEEENLALRVALRDERLSRRSALRRALRWKLALSQATKREGERDFYIRQKGIGEQTDAARIQGLETALREIGQHPARYGIDASDFALDALSQATKRET